MESETQEPSTYSLPEDPDSNIDKSLNGFKDKAGIASDTKVRIISKNDAPDGSLILSSMPLHFAVTAIFSALNIFDPAIQKRH